MFATAASGGQRNSSAVAKCEQSTDVTALSRVRSPARSPTKEVRCQFRYDHVGIAVHSIKSALKLYRDALNGDYLMGGEPDGKARRAQRQ
jgi:hypothetical protein